MRHRNTDFMLSNPNYVCIATLYPSHPTAQQSCPHLPHCALELWPDAATSNPGVRKHLGHHNSAGHREDLMVKSHGRRCGASQRPFHEQMGYYLWLPLWGTQQ